MIYTSLRGAQVETAPRAGTGVTVDEPRASADRAAATRPAERTEASATGSGRRAGRTMRPQRVAGALKAVLRDPERFSRLVLGRPLRPYQAEPLRAIVGAVLSRTGHSFSVMMARQAGKNELSGHLEAYLLTLFQRAGGDLVKCAPTFKPQVLISKRRLEGLLSNPWHAGRWHSELSSMVRLGRARAIFLSADEQANVVGITAHHLLEFDEAQDIAVEKHDRDFAPMAAATGCPRVYYGTAWDAGTLLARVAAVHREQERHDGLRRHFAYPWWVVAEHNPLYARYVEAERARLGQEHPLFRTQYCLEELDAAGRLFAPTQLALLAGEHPRERGPQPGVRYVAGVDLAGADEEAQDAALRRLKPRRDSTVVTVAAVEDVLLVDLVRAPRLRVVEHIWWTGRPHPQQYAELLHLLRDHWDIERVVVDASGVGAGVAGFLDAALGARCVPFVFSAASKSALGFDLLAAVNGGRLAVYAAPGAPEWEEFWAQCRAARSEMRANQQMAFFVPEAEGHDDFVISLALSVAAAGGAAPVPFGEVIPPGDAAEREGRY